MIALRIPRSLSAVDDEMSVYFVDPSLPTTSPGGTKPWGKNNENLIKLSKGDHGIVLIKMEGSTEWLPVCDQGLADWTEVEYTDPMDYYNYGYDNEEDKMAMTISRVVCSANTLGFRGVDTKLETGKHYDSSTYVTQLQCDEESMYLHDCTFGFGKCPPTNGVVAVWCGGFTI